MVKKGTLSKFLGGLLVCGMSLMPFRGEADEIRLLNISGNPTNYGHSEMFLKHQSGGEIGGDGEDISWYLLERPIGSRDNWLRISSDQINFLYGISGEELQTDNRPADTNLHANFPLILDTQYKTTGVPGDPITSSNNYVRFELQSGPDLGREFYHWNMSLTNGAQFADGTFNKSGVWNLESITSTNLPGYNLNNVQGIYGFLNVFPSNSSGQVSNYQFIFNDENAGVNATNLIPYGSTFSTNFPNYVYQDKDPTNGIRYKATSIATTNVTVGVVE